MVRFVSYNVDMLGGNAKNPAPTEEGMQAAADTLVEVGAHTVALQEIQSEDALRELARRSGFEHSAFVPTNDPTSRHLGFLSRAPLTDVETNVERLFADGQRFVRDVAVVSVEMSPEQKARFGNAHLKADPYYLKPTTDAKKAEAVRIRGLEAAELSQIMAENQQRYPTQVQVVALDQNAPAGSPELVDLPGVDPLPDVASHPGRGVRLDALRVSPGLTVVNAFVHDTPKARASSDHMPVGVDVSAA